MNDITDHFIEILPFSFDILRLCISFKCAFLPFLLFVSHFKLSPIMFSIYSKGLQKYKQLAININNWVIHVCIHTFINNIYFLLLCLKQVKML